MTRTTVLAPGNTAADSTDIVVTAGQAVTVAIYQSSAGDYPVGVSFIVSQVTPGLTNSMALIGGSPRQVLLAGPGTFRVSRPAYTGTAFGVFTES
jgi:hypothetical protein